jgi:hypothetical protein
MFFALGAASSAFDALKALTSSKTSKQTTGASQDAAATFGLSSSNAPASIGPGSGSGGGGSQISPQTMSALLDAQSQSSAGATTASKSRSAALKDLFGQIDGDGDGKISKKEFETALGAGGTNLTQADSVFGKLDKDGDGSVSLKELASALKGGKKHHERDESSSGADDGSNSDPFAQALQGASTTSVTNSDGSVTTSLTYADGSKVTMTSAAGKSSSASATSSYNFIEQMIQRQAQAISSGTTASVSVSA